MKAGLEKGAWPPSSATAAAAAAIALVPLLLLLCLALRGCKGPPHRKDIVRDRDVGPRGPRRRRGAVVQQRLRIQQRLHRQSCREQGGAGQREVDTKERDPCTEPAANGHGGLQLGPRTQHSLDPLSAASTHAARSQCTQHSLHARESAHDAPDSPSAFAEKMNVAR